MNYFTLLFLSLSTLFSQAQNASKYMNHISEEAKSVRASTWEYTNSVAKNKSATKVEDKRQDLIRSIEKSQAKIKEMGDFKGDTYYRDSVISFLNTYKKVVSEDYETIKTIEANSKNALHLKDKYILAKENANTKLLLASEMLDEVEKTFAKEHNVSLVKTKSKVAEKLKNTKKVYNYYNSIFMLFYKSYSEEAYFLDALEKGDLVGMQEHQTNLLAYTKENLVRLNVKLDFEGDLSIVTNCKNLLDFYQAEAEGDFLKIIEFQKFKASYTKTKTDLEAKPSRTKEEVANFNKLVAQYNEQLNAYNELILKQNTKRENLINAWNQAGETFEEKNIN